MVVLIRFVLISLARVSGVGAIEYTHLEAHIVDRAQMHFLLMVSTTLLFVYYADNSCVNQGRCSMHAELPPKALIKTWLELLECTDISEVRKQLIQANIERIFGQIEQAKAYLNS
ncbi:hypothetical protein [Colwellia sp. MEBiC06753]